MREQPLAMKDGLAAVAFMLPWILLSAAVKRLRPLRLLWGFDFQLLVAVGAALLWFTGCASAQVPIAESPRRGSASGSYAISNMHEHIQSVEEGAKLLDAMKAAGIAHTILVGSPKQTIFFKGGFEGYDENNGQVLTLQRLHPDAFSAFCTVNPRDPDKLKKLMGYVRAGSKGVKLYSGHATFYDLPLTDPEMEPLYAYAQQRHLPVMFHVNLGRYLGEFEALMDAYPRLTVIVPHLGVSSIRLERLERLLRRYPKLYTDVSFGYQPFLIAALKRISKDPEKYRQFMQRYRSRVLFGTDVVVTSHPKKTVPWMADVFQCYRDMLEQPRYRCALMEEELNGLALEPDILRDIYERNPQRLLGRSR